MAGMNKVSAAQRIGLGGFAMDVGLSFMAYSPPESSLPVAGGAAAGLLVNRFLGGNPVMGGVYGAIAGGVLSRVNDPNFGRSMAKGIGTSLLWNAIGPVGNVLAIGGGVAALGSLAYEGGRERFYRNLSSSYARDIGGNYVDTKQAYTMRQAAVQAIERSRVTGRQVLGNEASYLHK
jgi:hypothetical protein